MDSNFDLALGRLAPTVRGLVKEVLEDVYLLNGHRHKPKIGDDANTFGTNIWRNSWFQLEEMFNEHLPQAKVTRQRHVLEIEIGATVLRFAKLGHSASDDLDPSRFFQSASRREMALVNQLQLFALDGEGHAVPPLPLSAMRYILVGHCGNPKDGLCKIVAGAVQPARTGEEPWIWSENLHVATGDMAEPEVFFNDPGSALVYSDGTQPDVPVTIRVEQPAVELETPHEEEVVS